MLPFVFIAKFSRFSGKIANIRIVSERITGAKKKSLKFVLRIYIFGFRIPRQIWGGGLELPDRGGTVVLPIPDTLAYIWP